MALKASIKGLGSVDGKEGMTRNTNGNSRRGAENMEQGMH